MFEPRTAHRSRRARTAGGPAAGEVPPPPGRSRQERRLLRHACRVSAADATDRFRSLGAAVDAARRDVAAGRALDLPARARELDAAATALAVEHGPGPALQSAVARARSALERVAALARARERLQGPATFGPPAPAAADVAAPAAPVAPTAPARTSARDSLLTPRVTIGGTLVVEKRVAGSELTLTWKLPPAAQDVVVQVEERPDPRSDYALVATESLGAATAWTVQLGEPTTRLVVRVDGRGGRVLGRARISGLTAANAASKWQRQATAT